MVTPLVASNTLVSRRRFPTWLPRNRAVSALWLVHKLDFWLPGCLAAWLPGCNRADVTAGVTEKCGVTPLQLHQNHLVSCSRMAFRRRTPSAVKSSSAVLFHTMMRHWLQCRMLALVSLTQLQPRLPKQSTSQSEPIPLIRRSVEPVLQLPRMRTA